MKYNLKYNLEVQTAIRPIASLQEEEVHPLIHLINKAYSRHSWLFPENRTNKEKFHEEVKNFDWVVLLTREQSEILGTALIKIEKNGLYFSNAAITLEHQGMGLGGKLLRAIEEFAQAKNLPKIHLVSVHEIGNVEYYKQKGYYVISEETQPKGTWGAIKPFLLATLEKTLQPS